MIRYLGQRIETVNGRENLAAFLGQQCFSGAPNCLAIVDNKNF